MDVSCKARNRHKSQLAGPRRVLVPRDVAVVQMKTGDDAQAQVRRWGWDDCVQGAAFQRLQCTSGLSDSMILHFIA